jgi:hypothetical protein
LDARVGFETDSGIANTQVLILKKAKTNKLAKLPESVRFWHDFQPGTAALPYIFPTISIFEEFSPRYLFHPRKFDLKI